MTRTPKPPRPPQPDQPNVHTLTYLAIGEILADRNPGEASHREWLKRRLDEEVTKVASKRVASMLRTLP